MVFKTKRALIEEIYPFKTSDGECLKISYWMLDKYDNNVGRFSTLVDKSFAGKIGEAIPIGTITRHLFVTKAKKE